MASSARCLLVLAALVGLLQFWAPRTFISPRAAAAGAAAVASASLNTLPAWAYSPEFADAQVLLARIPGGKQTKEKGIAVYAPAEDGFTDSQVAACLVIALVGLVAALDLARGLYFGLTPNKFKEGKSKGSITPLVKRLIEFGE
eukprot:TRINITY_DN95598_c0_g1_i1.p1 TRINITY_DN95598_c0_g1~~TRINITY_DN95598_c0_g1_i1.p1  ORF type:complete len:164 (-),score=36.12 TRINITY_DN95598_c0_g1_i1:46-477(-)